MGNVTGIDYEEIGLRIKEARIAEKMSQSELAEKANLALPTVSDIEHGKNNMGLDTFVRLIEALHVSADSILRADTPAVTIMFGNEIGELLADCSNTEMAAILSLLKKVKETMRINRGE